MSRPLQRFIVAGLIASSLVASWAVPASASGRLANDEPGPVVVPLYPNGDACDLCGFQTTQPEPVRIDPGGHGCPSCGLDFDLIRID